MFKNLFDTKLYLVGEYGKESNGNITWAVVGLFTSVDKAIEACKKNNYFYVQISVNKPFMPKKEDWIYPHQLTDALENCECNCNCDENCKCEEKNNE